MSRAIERLYGLLSEVSGRPTNEIHPEMALFGGGLNLDSLSGVNLMAGLSKTFRISLDDIDLAMDALDSVGSLSALVASVSETSPTSDRLLSTTAVDDAMEVLERVAQASRLQEGRAGVERVLSRIASSEGLTSRELASACALPTPTVSAVRKELTKAGFLLEAGRGACLTEAGERLVSRLVSGGNREDRGFDSYIQPRYLDLVDELTELLTPVLASRPCADTTLDQAKCLPETVAARAVLALEYGAICGRQIAFIGDDDFTSVGLGLLGGILESQGKLGPRQLIVLDIDSRIVETLNTMAQERALPLRAIIHDLRRPVPTEVAARCDAFFTDPPYTIPGAELFVSRGLETCRGRGALAFFSFASKGPGEMLAVHRSLSGMNLLTREVLPGFNSYEGASLWGNRSQMVVLEYVSHGPSSQAPEHAGPLYTAEVRRRRPEGQVRG